PIVATMGVGPGAGDGDHGIGLGGAVRLEPGRPKLDPRLLPEGAAVLCHEGRLRSSPTMRYGFYLPTRGPTATRAGILALAREGERLGLHSAMIADHLVFPVESESAYPYTVDRKHPGGGDALETFSILGVVAGATEKLRLVTSVLVLPYRNPVLTAKMVASLDVLSGGRVTLGVGV